MAQYRAIFQNAYFKGLATAAVVTMGLAAGQAQAADVTATEWVSLEGPDQKIEGTDALKLSGADLETAKEFTLTITSSGDHVIKSGAATAKNATIVYNNTNASSGKLDIKLETSAGSLDVKKFDLQQGKVIIAGQDSALKARTLNVGDGSGDALTSSIEIGTTSVLGDALSATSADTLTNIVVKSDGVITNTKASGASEVVKINAATLNIDGGKIVNVDPDTTPETNNTKTTINLAKGSLTNEGVIDVAAHGTVELTFTEHAITKSATDNTKLEKEFNVDGGTLDVKGKLVVSGASADPATLKLTSGSTVQGGGELIVSGAGTILEADLATVNNAAKGAKLNISGGTLNVGTSSVDLTANAQEANKLILASDAADTATGKIQFTAGSTLKAGSITFDTDLGASANLVANTITVTKADAQEVAITNAVLSANSGLTIDAKTTLKSDLALGTDSIAEVNGKKGFADLDDAAKIKALLANTGTISKGANAASALTVENNKSLKIDNGSWTNDVALTLGTDSAKGSLVVGLDDTTNKTAASLKFNAGSKLTLTSGDITVGGGSNNNLFQATLDLSELESGNFVIGTAQSSSMKVDKKGTIILSEDIAKKIVSADNTKLTTLVKEDGTLKVNGDFEISSANLTNTGTGAAGKIDLAGALQANELSVTGLNGTALNIKTGTLKAETLKLTADKPDTTEANIGSGTFLANSAVDSTGKLANIVLEQGSVLQLGDIENEVALSQGGNVNVNLNVNAKAANNGQILVSNGNWTGKDVTLTQSGDFVVGGDTLKDGKSVASFTSNQGGLSIVDANSTVTINKDSSATFAKFNQADGTVNVYGSLTLTGLESGTAESGDLTYGVENAAGTITVDGTKAVLTLGETAIKGISFEGSGDTTAIKYADGLANKDPFANTVKLDNFGTLKLAFAEGTEFTTAQIAALRKEFVSNPDGNGYLDLSKAVITDAGVVQQEDGSYTITHEELKKIEDLNNVVIANLENATVTGIKQGDAVTGVVGNLQAEGSVSEITIAGATLNDGSNGLANNQSGTTVDLSVNASGFLHLKNGGTANKITLTNGTANNVTQLIVTDGSNTIAKIDGKGAETSLSLNGDAQVKVNESVKVGSINTQEGTSLDITTNLNTSNATTKSVIKGDLKVAGTSTFAGETELAGQNNVLGNVTFQKAATLSGKSNTLGVATFQDNAKITQGQTFATDVKLASTKQLVVGTDPSEALPDGASANLVTDKLTLAGGTLYVDPSYNVASSIVVTGDLTNAPAADKTDAGSLGGTAVALQNSILAVGLDTTDKAAALAAVKSELAPLFKANGALDKDKIGAVAYTAKSITLGANDKLVVDSTKSLTDYQNATAPTQALYLGKNSALAVDAQSFEGTKAPVTLQNNSAVYAGDGAKVLLTGSNVVAKVKGEKLFDGTGLTLDSASVNAEQKKVLRVETINGWFTQDLTDLNTDTLALSVNDAKMKGDLAGISAPVADTLMSVAYGHKNYEAVKADPNVEQDVVYGDATGFYKNADKYYTDPEFKNEFTPDSELVKKLANEQIDTKTGAVYFAPKNELIDNIVYNNGTAIDAETNARLAVFGGAPQAAIEAGASTYEAISARMGVGVSGVSAAANGQGGAIWVTPVYKSAESDGFAADNKSYGADVTLYGLALGADIEVAPNFKVGGMFNVGSGDADGQGLGANVSNDFDYYGLGLYAGYSMDALSLVADVTYTAVDNDIEGNTDLGKVNASIDSTNISVGVTGQYKLSLAGMDVTPHAGLRYSMIDMDDYATAYSQNDSDSLNILSVPVGVTIAKEYVTDTWTVKPSFDLTLTGNFGDDEAEATAKWNGFSNLSTTVKSEIMDNFTYGAAVGVSATSGNFGLGLGVNYTGSSNTDEFGVNANARYMF